MTLRGPCNERLTVPLCTACNPEARASHATIRAISCTKFLVSRALVSLERSWESFARRHGWVEMWMLEAIGDGGASLLDDAAEGKDGSRYRGV